MGAESSIEWFDRVTLGEGDVSGVFRGDGVAPGDAGFEESRPETPLPEGRSHPNGEKFATAVLVVGPAIAMPTTIVPSTAAATLAPSPMAARMRACPATGSDGATTRGARLSRSHVAESGWMISGRPSPGVGGDGHRSLASEPDATGSHQPRSRAT